MQVSGKRCEDPAQDSRPKRIEPTHDHSGQKGSGFAQALKTLRTFLNAYSRNNDRQLSNIRGRNYFHLHFPNRVKAWFYCKRRSLVRPSGRIHKPLVHYSASHNGCSAAVSPKTK
jgi:hypothetical protein